MSEIQLISPLLDNFDVGGSISEHHGVACYPAMKKDSTDRYIIKKVSIPPSQTQLDALLLTGACADMNSAAAYFEDQANTTVWELETLQELAKAEGFLGYEDWQVCAKEDAVGFDVYMIGSYKYSLRKYLQHKPITHLNAVNLGLDICDALAHCRRAGYLFVDLKPNNIYVEDGHSFKIGDLGLLRLDSLQYASLPDKYCSAYTAPEALDAFSALTPTLDIYAMGLILYQAYNGGELPFRSQFAPAVKFDPPAFADYEMAEIILKACDPDPDARWQDPAELGQALVSYMQRNGANDTPIVPPIIKMADEIEEAINQVDLAEDAIVPEDTSDPAPAQVTDEDLDLSDINLDDIPDVEEITDDSPDVAVDEDLFQNEEDEDLSFLDEITADETAPENTLTDVDYEEVSEELSEILSQADELVSHPVPSADEIEEPGEIDVMELINEVTDVIEAVEPTQLPEQEDESSVDADDEPEEIEETDEEESVEPDDQEAETPEQLEERRSRRNKKLLNWLLTIIIFLVIAALSAFAIFYYRNVYLLPIDKITVNGSESSILVQVDTDIDQTLLSVVCSDSHGNQISAPVVKGAATFTNLTPDTAYTVRIQVDGFHRLTGDTAATYTTPAQTNIVSFTAVTGAEAGSAILSFTLEGPDTGEWKIYYSAEGEEKKAVEALSHMVELSGLTVGKEYTFTLIPGEDMYVSGITEITHVASDLIYAENVQITSCVDGKMTVVWDAPENVEVPNWTVRCYNDGEYNQTAITAETTAMFEDIDIGSAYTVEVSAAGMSVTQRVFMAENPITVTNFNADTSTADVLNLTWDTNLAVPADGWVLLYTVDGAEAQGSVACVDNSAQISPVVPGATYTFKLQQTNGTAALSEPMVCVIPEAQEFSGYGMTRGTMSFQLCKRPEGESWIWSSLEDSDFTSSFAVGEKIAILGQLHGRYSVSNDNITSLFVIRDAEGNLVNYSHSSKTWSNMWELSYGEIDIPEIPAEPGSYTLSLYFNGCLATQKDFTIS